jgi:formylglycine-generating enzyme required for sulfatase activity
LALGRLGDPRDFTETVMIPAGEFPYGTEKQPCVLPAYRIGRYLVTQAQYAEFLQAHPEIPVPYVDEDWARVYNWDPEKRTYPAGRSNQPVVLVTWDEAVAYCTWAGGRLPTQEEWERAARGTDGRSYPWGESFTLVHANTRESGLGGPTPVGIFVEGESPTGALDMAGNVWEWTASDHDQNTKILRGGAWSFPAESARTYVSERSRPHNRSHAIGFRVVFPST